VVRVLVYRSGGPGSIPGTTKKKVVGLERGSCLENLEYGLGIRHADHVVPSIRKIWQSLRRQAAVARSL
jgi:hypothetical protein